MRFKKSRVILLDVTLESWIPPHGVLSIGNFLISKGFPKENFKIVQRGVNLYSDLKKFKPTIIGISSNTPRFPLAVKYAKKFKKLFKETTLVIGGIHITALPEELGPFDLGVLGEGEVAFYEIVKLLEKKESPKDKKFRKIRGLIYRDSEGRIRNSPRQSLIKPIDILPPIDWSLLPDDFYFKNVVIFDGEKYRSVEFASIYSARSCPYNCIYCSVNIACGNLIRFFSAKRTVDEIEKLHKNYNTECIQFLDETFTLNKKRIKEIISELKKRKLLGKIFYDPVFTRADTIDEEFCYLLKKLGVTRIDIGFESGSEKILSFLKSGTIKVKDNYRAMDLLEKHKFDMKGFFLFCSPGETNDDQEKTLNLIEYFLEKNNTVSAKFGILTPFPGTKLWDLSIKKKLISKPKNWEKFMLEPSFLSDPERIFTKKPPKPFFKGKYQISHYEKIWNKAQKLWRKKHRELKKRRGWREACRKAKLKNERKNEIWMFKRKKSWLFKKKTKEFLKKVKI